MSKNTLQLVFLIALLQFNYFVVKAQINFRWPEGPL